MKLDAVDKLAVIPFDHHLIFAEVGRCQQFETFRNTYDLDAVILPDAQDVIVRRIFLPNSGTLVIISFEDRIRLINDLYKSMLPLPAFCASGRQETGITPKMSAASFQKILEINKSDVKHPKTVKGMKNFPATKGGVESVSWLHPLGHDVPENAGKFIVPFFKRHHL